MEKCIVSEILSPISDPELKKFGYFQLSNDTSKSEDTWASLKFRTAMNLKWDADSSVTIGGVSGSTGSFNIIAGQAVSIRTGSATLVNLSGKYALKEILFDQGTPAKGLYINSDEIAYCTLDVLMAPIHGNLLEAVKSSKDTVTKLWVANSSLDDVELKDLNCLTALVNLDPNEDIYGRLEDMLEEKYVSGIPSEITIYMQGSSRITLNGTSRSGGHKITKDGSTLYVKKDNVTVASYNGSTWTYSS